MAQPDQNWNPPRGPRHRYPRGRGRGQGQASSDPTPAPQTLQRQGQHALTLNQQRHSDPFQYDTQSMPYWDDSSGAIHDIPSVPPRHPAQSHAQVVGGGTEAAKDQPQQTRAFYPELQSYKQHQWYNPYAGIVGGGPYAENQASYTTRTAPATESVLATQEKKSKRRDFTPYFDAADAQNSADLRSLHKYGFLGTKGVNQELRQSATDAIKTATAKRDKANTENALPLLPGSAPDTLIMGISARDRPETPTLFKSNFQLPTSPRIPKSRIVSSNKTTETEHMKPLSAVVEAPSPLKITNQPQNTRRNTERTPTLDRVLRLRAEEQAKALAKLEGEIIESMHGDEDHRHAPGELVKRTSDSGRQRFPKTASREEKRQASELMPELATLKQDKQNDICMVKDLTASIDENDASSSVYSSDDNAQEDEIDELTKAIAHLRPFQDLPSPSPNKPGFHRKSAVPVGLDMSKIADRETQEAPDEKTLLSAEEQLVKVPNAADTESRKGMQTSQEDSSPESFATAESEDYEQIGVREELVTEQNGVKRRWYKGFRKV